MSTEMQNTATLKQLGFEISGVAIFVFIVLQATASWQVAIGLLACLLIAGPISGGHLNPAVSSGFYMSNKISGEVCIKYIFAQIVGGLLGGLIFWMVNDQSATTLN